MSSSKKSAIKATSLALTLILLAGCSGEPEEEVSPSPGDVGNIAPAEPTETPDTTPDSSPTPTETQEEPDNVDVDTITTATPEGTFTLIYTNEEPLPELAAKTEEEFIRDFTTEGGEDIGIPTVWDNLQQEERDFLWDVYVAKNPLSKYVAQGNLTEREIVLSLATLHLTFNVILRDTYKDVEYDVTINNENLIKIGEEPDNDYGLDPNTVAFTINGEATEQQTPTGEPQLVVTQDDNGAWKIDLTDFNERHNLS